MIRERRVRCNACDGFTGGCTWVPIECGGCGSVDVVEVGHPSPAIVLICGSREWPREREQEIAARVAELPEECVVITGRARGVDCLARAAAVNRGLWVIDVPVEGAHWERHGKRAGPRRNALMRSLDPDLVIAFHAGDSPGTAGMIDCARRDGLFVEVHS